MIGRKTAVAMTAAILLFTAAMLVAGDGKEKLRRALGDPDPSPEWIYDDFWGAVAVAKKTDKPLLTVFR